MTTDYIIPRFEIVVPEFRKFKFGREDRYKNIARKCVDMDKACNTCFS